MPGFVVGRGAPLFLTKDAGGALGADHDLVLGLFEIDHGDFLVAEAGGQQAGFVHKVLQIRTGKAGSALRDLRGIHVGLKGDLALVEMHAQDAFAAAGIGQVDHHLTVEAPGTQQGGVEHVGPVGGGDEDDAIIGGEPVHLHKQLVQGLLAFVMPTAQTGAPLAANGVDFIDENDARRVLLALFEQVAHARRAHADEHFDEVGTRHAEKRNVGLTGHGFGQQRFPRTRRPEQQHPLRDPPAQAAELRRILEEVDDLVQFDLGFVASGDILEGHLRAVFVRHTRLDFAEAEQAARPAHLSRLSRHHEPEEQDEQEYGQEARQQGEPARPLSELDLDAT